VQEIAGTYDLLFAEGRLAGALQGAWLPADDPAQPLPLNG